MNKYHCTETAQNREKPLMETTTLISDLNSSHDWVPDYCVWFQIVGYDSKTGYRKLFWSGVLITKNTSSHYTVSTRIQGLAYIFTFFWIRCSDDWHSWKIKWWWSGGGLKLIAHSLRVWNNIVVYVRFIKGTYWSPLLPNTKHMGIVAQHEYQARNQTLQERDR